MRSWLVRDCGGKFSLVCLSYSSAKLIAFSLAASLGFTMVMFKFELSITLSRTDSSSLSELKLEFSLSMLSAD